MKTSNEGKVEIIGHEGICLSKYKDSVGVWTIGIGATRTEISDIAQWPLDRNITIQEAFDLFGRSIVKYETAINKALKVSVPQHMFDALVSWCYNVGVGWAPKSTVIKLINQGVAGQVLYTALMAYNKPREIIGRRTKEATLLAFGTYCNKGKALLFPVNSKGTPVYAKGKQINVWEYIPHSTSDQPVPYPVTEAVPSPILDAVKKLISIFKG
jgi:lysozyme